MQGPVACGFPIAEALGLVMGNCAIDSPPQQDEQPAKEETANDMQDRYLEQFDRMCNLPQKVKLHLRDDAMQFTDARRKYSIYMKPKLKA